MTRNLSLSAPYTHTTASIGHSTQAHTSHGPRASTSQPAAAAPTPHHAAPLHVLQEKLRVLNCLFSEIGGWEREQSSRGWEGGVMICLNWFRCNNNNKTSVVTDPVEMSATLHFPKASRHDHKQHNNLVQFFSQARMHAAAAKMPSPSTHAAMLQSWWPCD